MQKYYITDGSNYVKQSKGKFTTVNSHVMATEFPKREGARILRFNLGKNYANYRLEGIEDFEQITQEQIAVDTINEREVVVQTSSNAILEAKLSGLESYVGVLTKADPIAGGDLDSLRSEIESSISYYDLCLSDIYHWILDNKPPAHVMTKVYCLLRETLQKRKRVKEDLGFTNVLIESEKFGQNSSETKKKLLNKVYDPYVPRTQIWRELETLAGNKEAVK